MVFFSKPSCPKPCAYFQGLKTGSMTIRGLLDQSGCFEPVRIGDTRCTRTGRTRGRKPDRPGRGGCVPWRVAGDDPAPAAAGEAGRRGPPWQTLTPSRMLRPLFPPPYPHSASFTGVDRCAFLGQNCSVTELERLRRGRPTPIPRARWRPRVTAPNRDFLAEPCHPTTTVAAGQRRQTYKIAVFRNPVSRIVSGYNYVRGWNRHWDNALCTFDCRCVCQDCLTSHPLGRSLPATRARAQASGSHGFLWPQA